MRTSYSAFAVDAPVHGADTVDAAVVSRALAAVDRPLSGEQGEAVRSVTASGNGVDVVEALAGTGRTFTAGALRQVYGDAGYRVVGVAPTGRAVRELAEEAGVAAAWINLPDSEDNRSQIRLPPRLNPA